VLLFLMPSRYLSGQNGLTDSLVTEKLRTIQQMFNQGKPNANRWWYGWLIGYSAATVVQASVLLTSDDIGTRQDMALGAVTTLLGAAGQIVTPMVPGYAPDRMDHFPERTTEEKMTKLIESEKLLKESALREKNGRSWKTHAVCGVVSISSGLITWIGFDRNILAGLGNFALNMVISEVQIFTMPIRAQKDYNNYLAKYYGGQEQSHKRSDMSWSFNVYPGRVSVQVVF